MFGSEYHYITEMQFKSMLQVICVAMGDGEVRRLDGTRLLEVVRVKHQAKQWRSESEGDAVPRYYWDSLRGTKGKQGPISMRCVLGKVGIVCLDPEEWRFR